MVFTRDDVNSMAFSTFMRDYTPFGEYVDGDKRYQFNDLDFMLFKMEDALEPLNSLAMNNFDKDYSNIEAAKDNLLMLFDDVAEKAGFYSHLDFVNDRKIKETFGPVRKTLNVPDEEDSDSNYFDFGSSK